MGGVTPESYVSRIWKGPSFLPGIIENRCRLSLYADQHSLARGLERAFFPSSHLPGPYRRFYHRETDSSRFLHPSYCYSVTAKTTGVYFPRSLDGRRPTILPSIQTDPRRHAVVKETLNPLPRKRIRREIARCTRASSARIIHAGSAFILSLLLLLLLFLLSVACASRDIAVSTVGLLPSSLFLERRNYRGYFSFLFFFSFLLL